MYFAVLKNQRGAFLPTGEMKIKVHHIIIICLLALLSSVEFVRAQESGFSDIEIIDSEKDRAERDKIIYSPGESDTRYTGKSTNTLPAKESAETVLPTSPIVPRYKAEKPTPTIKPTVEKQSKNQDDSILSFNFLYYIIEKYKLQDIVD